MKRREALDGAVVMELMPGYLRVFHSRSARDLAETELVLAAMDGAMRDWQQDRLMFDSREANDTLPEVGARIWSWLQGHPDVVRVATLVESSELADRINMGEIGVDGVRIRAFHRERAAARWLTILK